MAALLLGVASFLLPFAVLKENRVTDGSEITGAELAGPLVTLVSLCAVALLLWAATGERRAYHRRPVYYFIAFFCFWLSAALLVRAGKQLPAGAAPRVSPTVGFFGLPMACFVLLNHARGTQKGTWRILTNLVLYLPVVFIFAGGRGNMISLFQEWSARKGRFAVEAITHLRLFALAVAAAALIGIPLGIAASRNKRVGRPIIAFVDAAQTIPSLALFGLLMSPLAALSRAFPVLRDLGIRGIGAAPALIALVLYALLAIVRNTVTGLAEVPPSAYEAGRGMGMSPYQLFRRVEWPLAMPHVLTGLRTASVQAVGNTAVAALIGAGGLGMMIFQGLGQAAPDLVLLGVIPLILLAVAVDRMWGLIIRKTVSPGLRSAL